MQRTTRPVHPYRRDRRLHGRDSTAAQFAHRHRSRARQPHPTRPPEFLRCTPWTAKPRGGPAAGNSEQAQHTLSWWRRTCEHAESVPGKGWAFSRLLDVVTGAVTLHISRFAGPLDLGGGPRRAVGRRARRSAQSGMQLQGPGLFRSGAASSDHLRTLPGRHYRPDGRHIIRHAGISRLPTPYRNVVSCRPSKSSQRAAILDRRDLDRVSSCG